MYWRSTRFIGIDTYKEDWKLANSGNLSTDEREPPGCPVLLHTISKTIPTQQNRHFYQIQNPGSTLNTKAYTHIMNYLQNKARMV